MENTSGWKRTQSNKKNRNKGTINIDAIFKDGADCDMIVTSIKNFIRESTSGLSRNECTIVINSVITECLETVTTSVSDILSSSISSDSEQKSILTVEEFNSLHLPHIDRHKDNVSKLVTICNKFVDIKKDKSHQIKKALSKNGITQRKNNVSYKDVVGSLSSELTLLMYR
jgi:hypothetical protein